VIAALSLVICVGWICVLNGPANLTAVYLFLDEVGHPTLNTPRVGIVRADQLDYFEVDKDQRVRD
jgi:hypothetical protein